MFKKIVNYFKKEKELMKRTEELHAKTEEILKKEEDRKSNPVFRPIEPLKVKFADTENNIYEVEMFSEEFSKMMSRQDVRMIFD